MSKQDAYDRQVLNQELGEAIKEKRNEKGWSQAKLAERIGVGSSSVISGWEYSGRGIIGWRQRECLMDVLGMTREELTWSILNDADLLKKTLAPMMLGQRIKFLREGRGMMIDDLAEKSGVSKTTVIQYGKKDGIVNYGARTREIIRALAKALEVPEEVFYVVGQPVTEGEKWRNRRILAKLTSEELADLVGVGNDTVRHWESGAPKYYMGEKCRQRLMKIFAERIGEEYQE